MTPQDYDKHFKVLGKLARMFDQASPDVSTQNLLIARLYDQVADGETETLDAVLILSAFVNQFSNAVTASGISYATTARSAALAYLESEYFKNDLITVFAGVSAAQVLNALATDMSAVVDDVTLSDESATGLVRFFKSLGATATWNTEPDATADYKDSVYVVDAIVV